MLLTGSAIVARSGMYTGAGNKNLAFKGKAITLCSKHGPANCIIDCQNDGKGIYFRNGESLELLPEGLTTANSFGGNCVRWRRGVAVCRETIDGQGLPAETHPPPLRLAM